MLTNKNIHWNTVYKFFIKLQKYNIITLTYNELIKKYCNKYFKNKSNILLTDTTMIPNKLGINNIGYNPQIPKHNPILANNKNILLGDAGYDSNKLRLKLININFGKLVTSKKNIKDPIKLLTLKLTIVEKAL